MSSFAENMRRIRFEHHMTQEEFAELLGTTKQNVSRYESGAVSPKITTASIIADKLGISLSELSGHHKEPQESKQTVQLKDISSVEFALYETMNELSEAAQQDVLRFALFRHEQEAKEKAKHDD